MPAENKRNIPDWARQEREADLRWVQGQTDVFFSIAITSYKSSSRRGALVVDTTVQMPGLGHPFSYVIQELLAELNDSDINRMVREYEPKHEFVIVLWKTDDRTSTYRVRPLKRLD